MRYRLRTLLIVLALGPPLIWAGWWVLGMPPIPVIFIVWLAVALLTGWRTLKGDWPPAP